jgi:hypothetical protein
VVETLELPAAKTSLDTVLRLRDSAGDESLHLIEWQGYTDRLILWRTLGYLAWLGQNRSERPIKATVIYLSPEDDVGETLVQAPHVPGGWSVTLSCIRLWQQDAQAALESGAPGLMALTPLMRGATAVMVEQAAQGLIQQTAPPSQGELLAALGIFAEPLVSTERFIRLVTKERLMTSDLISYLLKDKLAEMEQAHKQELARLEQEKAGLEQKREQERTRLEQEKAGLEQEKAGLEQKREQERTRLEQEKAGIRGALHVAIINTLQVRFPNTPSQMLGQVTRIEDAVQLQRVFQLALNAASLSAVKDVLDELVG